ncbi:MAG: hypothetical protein ACOX2O_03295 [Bdellovibrionota bacterium]|jgi:hypothetical protein
MIFCAAIFLLFSIMCSGWWSGLLAIVFAGCVFFSALSIDLSLCSYILLMTFLAAVPFSAYVTALLLDNITWENGNKQILHTVIFGGACYFAFSSDMALTFVEAALAAATFPQQLLILIAIINGACLCGSVVALGIIFLLWLVELPFLWISRALRSRVFVPFTALRPTLVCLLLTVFIHTIATFFVENLAPNSERFTEIVQKNITSDQ